MIEDLLSWILHKKCKYPTSPELHDDIEAYS